MGGKSAETVKNTSQQTASTNNFSGTRDPYAPSVPLLGGILGQAQGQLANTSLTPNENAAFGALEETARGGNPFAPQISGLASDLFAGGGPDRTGIVQSAYDQYVSGLTPTASGDFLDPQKNPFFDSTVQGITDMVNQRVNALYSGAGRDPAGAGSFPGMLGDSVAQALAPYFMNVYQGERGNQLNALNSLFGAGGQTAGLLSGLDQTALSNRLAGVGAADASLQAQNYGPQLALAIEAQKRGIPMHQLQQIAGIGLPIAGVGGTTSGISSGVANTTGQEVGSVSKPFDPLALAGLGLAFV